MEELSVVYFGCIVHRRHEHNQLFLRQVNNTNVDIERSVSPNTPDATVNCISRLTVDVRDEAVSRSQFYSASAGAPTTASGLLFRLALRTESRHPPPAGLAPCANGLRRAAAAARRQPSMAPKGKKAPAAPPPPPSDWIPESTSKEFMDCNEAVVTHLRAGRADSCRGKPLLCNGRFRVTYEITHSSSPVAQGMLLGVCDATAWSTGDEKGNCEAALQRRSSTSLRSTATHKEYSRARMLHLVCCRSHAPPAQTWMRSK